MNVWVLPRPLMRPFTKPLREQESKLPKHKNMIITVRDEDKEDMVGIARRFQNVGYRIFATKGTAKVLNEQWSEGIRGSQDRAGVSKPVGPDPGS